MVEHSRKPPQFVELSAEECWEILARNHVGRIAFLNEGYPDIEPVHYVAMDGWLVVRSAHGTKLEKFAHRPYVAFEVDEVESLFDWRSVVARGTVYPMADTGSHVNRETYEKALLALRTLIPETLTENDPVPMRRQVYGIYVDRMTGRAAHS